MDNGQNTPNTGINSESQDNQAASAPLQTGAAIPAGATIGESSQNSLQVGAPIPQGATIGQPASDELNANPEDTTGTKVIKDIGGGLEGVGEGIFGTAAGISDIANKGGVSPLALADKLSGGAINKELHKLAGDNDTTHGTPQEIGRGLETIGEFLSGDEALKGLSIADRLTQVSKIMKYVEKMPRLAQALRLGINVGKAGIELSPEERALISAHPVLARLVGVGYDALRQGVVQGLQTETKSGGQTSPEDALKSAGEMAGGSAIIGAPLGVAGGLLAKGGEAANKAAQLRDIASQAPTATEGNAQLKSTVQNTLQPIIDQAQTIKNEAEEKLAGAGSAVEGIIKGAPTKSDIVTKAQNHAKAGEQAIRDAYTQASESLRNDPDLKDVTIPGTGSSFQQKAAEAAFGIKEGDAVRKALGAAIPASPETMNLATSLAKPKGLLDLDEAGNPKELNIDNLLDYAKDIKEKIRSLGYSTPQDMRDRQVYYNLLDGVHQSVEDLVNEAGKPELMDKIQKMNQDYREGIQTFKNPDVKKLLQGTNENAIIGTLTGGKSIGDIKAIKQAIGNKAFASLSDDAMSRLAADSTNPSTGQFDIKNWIRNMTNIPANVRAEMFNDTTKSGALENILKQVQQTQGTSAIENSEKVINDAQKTMHDIIGGNPNLIGLTSNPAKVQQLGQLIGPDAMGALGDTILRNQLREAATKESGAIGSVDTGQFLRFIGSLKDSPEIVDAFFKPTPERAAAYDKLLKSVHNVEGVKNMMKIGLIAPTIGAAVGGGLGHSVFSAILGSLAAEGAGGYFSKARDFLDTVANHPAVWKTLSAVSKSAQGGLAKSTANIAKVAAGKGLQYSTLKNIYQNTSTQLANQ